MRKLFTLGIAVLLSHNAAKALFCAVDSIFLPSDSLIGYATSNFFSGVPESPLGNLVADAMRAKAISFSGDSSVLALLSVQSIRGKIGKGEIYAKTVYALFPQNDTLRLYAVPAKDIHILVDAVARKGGMPCAGFSFEILNMKAINLLVNGQKTDTAKNYVLVSTTYTMRQIGFGENYLERAVNGTLRDVLCQYITEKTNMGEAIYSTPQRRIIYKK